MPKKKASHQKSQYQKFLAAVRKEEKDQKGRPFILAEGDSWFAFPKEMRPNVIESLDRSLDLVLRCLAKSGDETRYMLTGKQLQLLTSYLQRWDFDILLFSGGGNDIVGENLLPLLKDVSSSDPWRAALNEPVVEAAFTIVESHYKTLIQLRDKHRPNCVIMTHCYDFPIPDLSGSVKCLNRKVLGPWLSKYMVMKGLEDPSKQRQLAKYLIQQHKSMLKKLASENANFVFIDTIGTLADNEWGDELHPTKAGFKKVADKFAAEIVKRFPAAKK